MNTWFLFWTIEQFFQLSFVLIEKRTKKGLNFVIATSRPLVDITDNLQSRFPTLPQDIANNKLQIKTIINDENILRPTCGCKDCQFCPRTQNYNQHSYKQDYSEKAATKSTNGYSKANKPTQSVSFLLGTWLENLDRSFRTNSTRLNIITQGHSQFRPIVSFVRFITHEIEK